MKREKKGKGKAVTPVRNNPTVNHFGCCYCSRRYETKSELSLHLYGHLKLFRKDAVTMTDSVGLKTAKDLFKRMNHAYFCAKCGKSFFNLAISKYHCNHSHRGSSRIIALMFRDGRPSEERKMLTFEEFAKEDMYIDYETNGESKQNSIPEVTTFHPCVFLRDLTEMKKKEFEELMMYNGTKRWNFKH